MYGYIEADDDTDDDKTKTCPPSQGRTKVLLHPIPHRNEMRCLQLVALYDMQEDAVGLYNNKSLSRTRSTFNIQIQIKLTGA